MQRLVVLLLGVLQPPPAAPPKYFETSRNVSAAETQKLQAGREAAPHENQKLHQSRSVAPTETQNAARELEAFNRRNPDASTRIQRKRVPATGVLPARDDSVSAAAQRPSSPAAGSRSEERAQAVGGRVQRLVGRLVKAL